MDEINAIVQYKKSALWKTFHKRNTLLGVMFPRKRWILVYLYQKLISEFPHLKVENTPKGYREVVSWLRKQGV